MKYRPLLISLFIFSVIGLLAALSALYPEDGMTVGNLTLRFPTLTEFLQENNRQDTLPALSPEQLMQQRLAQMRMEEEQEFIRFFQLNPARICFPKTDTSLCSIGDSAYLDTFFAALESADTSKVGVVHYGDSQIEEDRITAVLRQRLQERFTGNGVGLIPLHQSVQTHTIGQTTSIEPQRYMVYGPATWRRASDQYGPMGQVAIIDTIITLRTMPRSQTARLSPAHYCNRLTLLTHSRHTIKASLQGQKQTIIPNNEPLQTTLFHLKDSTTQVRLRIEGKGEIYGIVLDSPTGVNVDNIPMRGCSGTIFTAINARQLQHYFSTNRTSLIILQYGGNSVPALHSEKRIQDYLNSLTRQIHYLQRLAPHAAILFIGPSDMSTRLKGKWQTYPVLPEFEERLSKAVTQAGAAYWSMFDAMGGEGSMLQWRQTGLAGSDYIHFTRKGAEKMGEMLYQALMAGYDYYHWRTAPPPLNMDTIVPDSLTQPNY